MPTLRSGDAAVSITIANNDALTVTAPPGSVALVQSADFSVNGSVTGAVTVFGPYPASTQVSIACSAGAVQWSVAFFGDEPADAISAGQVLALKALAAGTGVTWANRPNPVTAGLGALQWISDVGGGSLWRSDGTYWRPLNGRVVIGRQAGTVAVPVASMALGGAGLIITLSAPPTIPVGMAIPGSSSIMARAIFIHRGTAGLVSPRIFVGPTLGTSTGAALIKSHSLGATDGSCVVAVVTMDIRTNNAQVAPSYNGDNAVSSNTNGLLDQAIDFSVPQYVMFGLVSSSLGTSPDTLDLVSYEVSFFA